VYRRLAAAGIGAVRSQLIGGHGFGTHIVWPMVPIDAYERVLMTVRRRPVPERHRRSTFGRP